MSKLITINANELMQMEEKHFVYIEKLEAENARLREALTNLITACDQGRMVVQNGGAGGMTIENQIRGSVIHGVPAWPVEEAREALEGK